MKTPIQLCICAAAALLLSVSTSPAPTLNVTSFGALDRNANLVANGSFELGHPPGAGYIWVSGSTLGPFAPIPSWTSAGGINAYGVWGDSAALEGSAPLPHGTNGLYFGNAFVSAISASPSSYSAGGVYTFASPPTITPQDATYSPAVNLRQTVSLNIGTLYRLSFWTSGENAAAGGYPSDGLFEVNVSGYDRLFLGTPSAGVNSVLGSQKLYDIEFTALSASTTLSFINYGHFVREDPQTPPTAGWTFAPGTTTELVLDDVILNAVPEPGTLALAALAGAMLLWRRKRNA